jgi:hypothetical protein
MSQSPHGPPPMVNRSNKPNVGEFLPGPPPSKGTPPTQIPAASFSTYPSNSNNKTNNYSTSPIYTPAGSLNLKQQPSYGGAPASLQQQQQQPQYKPALSVGPGYPGGGVGRPMGSGYPQQGGGGGYAAPPLSNIQQQQQQPRPNYNSAPSVGGGGYGGVGGPGAGGYNNGQQLQQQQYPEQKSTSKSTFIIFFLVLLGLGLGLLLPLLLLLLLLLLIPHSSSSSFLTP